MSRPKNLSFTGQNLQRIIDFIRKNVYVEQTNAVMKKTEYEVCGAECCG